MNHLKLRLYLPGLLVLGAAGCIGEQSEPDRAAACADDDSACSERESHDESAARWWPRHDGGRGPRPRRDTSTPDASSTDAGPDAEPAPVDAGADGSAGQSGPFTRDCSQPGAVGRTRRAGNRVLSAGNERWVLLDLDTRREIASGPVGAFAAGEGRGMFDLSASHVLVPLTNKTLELRSAQDGEVIATLSADSSFDRGGLAQDGSYVWARTNGLSIWSLTGEVLVRHDNRSRPGWVFAAPGELRAIHQNAFYPTTADERPLGFWREVVRTDGSARLIANYVGDFKGFLDDGNRYFTVPTSNLYLLHPFHLGTDIGGHTLVTFAGFTMLGGYRDVVWGTPPDKQQLNVYVLPAAQPEAQLQVQLPTPVLSLTGPVTTGAVRSERGSVALFGGADASAFALVDVRSRAPVVEEVRLPSAPLPASFASDGLGGWAVATTDTLYASGTEAPVALGCRAP